MYLVHREINVEDPNKILRAVRDRFFCPDKFLKYRLSGELSQDSGYFEIGADAVCYGRSVGALHRTRPPFCTLDSNAASECGAQPLVFPFDADEVIDNLRLERYPGCQLAHFEKSLKSTYYRLRPFTSRRLRSYVQRLRAANWKRRRFPRWPVDTTVENICDSLLLHSLHANAVDRIPFIWFWPDGAQGCVSITHDVETAAGLDFCTDLMDLDDSFGIKSSFQVVPTDRYTLPRSFPNRLRDRGFELCIQDLNHDGRLFDEREEFSRRAVLINRYAQKYGAKGFRSAVLYRRPEWLECLEFSYEMSMPNVAHLDPQRGGCCTVTPYFIGRMLELPLTTIQDYTLFHVLNERSVDLWNLQLEMILARNGLASFLVHPDYIIEHETRAVYRKLLVLLSEVREQESVWFALPGEIDAWWRQRSRMSIVADGGSWRIVGEGAQRASLAFATHSNGQLIYELADDKQHELAASRIGMPLTAGKPLQ